MKRIIMFVLLFAALKVAGQTTGYLRFDTVKIMRQNGYCELYIINKTKDSLGLLTNVGGGLTQFKKPRSLSDSTIVIGNDTLKILGRPGSVNWCNVVQSGVDPTGATDISPYITTLMAAGCRYIYLPKGRYLVSSTIQMRDSVTIKGDGRNNTIIVLASNITAFKSSHALGGYNCQFLDFGFEGNIGVGTVDQTGILIDSTHGGYINNVGGYNMAGWTIKIKRNGYCCGTYTTTGVRGNIISDCYTQGCYGGVALDTLAEYNTVQNSTFVNGTYGIFVAGGNARINGNNCADNNYGIYLTGGSNNGHGIATGNTLNHNDSDIYCTGVTLGFGFVGNMIYAGSNQVTVIDCDNINFNGGDIAAGAITITNSTNTTFNDVRITTPVWTITGTPPTVVRNGKTQNASTITDVVANKDFNISQTDGIVNLNGSITRIRSAADTINFSTSGTQHIIAGGENASDSLTLMSNISGTKGRIKFGTSAYTENSNRLGLGIINPSTDLHIRRASSGGSVETRIQNDGVGASASARITLINDANFLTQIFQGSSINSFAPNGLLIHTQGAGGMRLAADAGDFIFNRTSAVGNEYLRIKYPSGNFLYNTTTDDAATGKFQIHSTSRFDSLMKLYNVTAPPATYNLLVHGLSDSGTYQIPLSAIGGITSINSQTGPAITLTGGIGTYTSAPSSNTIAYNVDPTSDIFTRTIDAIITTAGNSGTGETDLYTKTIAGGTLNADKQTLNIEIDGEVNDNTATAQLKLYFAGNVTLNTGAIAISTAPTAWRLRGYIIRTSTTTAHVTYELQCPGLATPLFIGYSNLTSLDFTTSNILKVTAQAGGAGGGSSDITAHSWQITYKPQP